jgi:thermitase
MPPRLQRLRHKRKRYYLLIWSMLALVGCSSLSPELTSTPARKHNPAYTLTVELTPGDTPASVAARYSADVLVWEPGAYALLGTDEVTLDPQLLGLGDTTSNDDAFYAGGEMTAYMSGKSRVWAGGKSRVWAGGKSRVWAGGNAELWEGSTFSWLPENTAKWEQIHLKGAQEIAANLGDGVKVAVIDTGVDLTHPALLEALAPAEQWKDFYDGDSYPQEEGSLADDGYGHGTNVAGIIRQIAPRATLLPIRVLGPDGGGNVADLTAAIQYAVNQSAQVINLSLGSEGRLFSAIDNAIKAATAKGVYVITSTGNTGDSAVTYPASSAKSLLGSILSNSGNLISVASVNANDVKSSFSTYGYPIKLTAPGEVVYGPAPDLSEAAWSGTSQAAPMASAALALALGEARRPFINLPTELLAKSDNNYGVNSTYRYRLGNGRLNLEAFLKSVVQD